MKLRFESYHPIKVGGKWSYTFTIMPSIDFFYIGEIKRFSFSWLFWDITLDFDPIEERYLKDEGK